MGRIANNIVVLNSGTAHCNYSTPYLLINWYNGLHNAMGCAWFIYVVYWPAGDALA